MFPGMGQSGSEIYLQGQQSGPGWDLPRRARFVHWCGLERIENGPFSGFRANFRVELALQSTGQNETTPTILLCRGDLPNEIPQSQALSSLFQLVHWVIPGEVASRQAQGYWWSTRHCTAQYQEGQNQGSNRVDHSRLGQT